MLWYVLHSILHMHTHRYIRIYNIHTDLLTYTFPIHPSQIMSCPCRAMPCHAICTDLAGHETGRPSVEAEIGKKTAAVYGWTGRELHSTHNLMSLMSLCRNGRLFYAGPGGRGREEGGLLSESYSRSILGYGVRTLSLARPASHSTAFNLPWHQNRLDMSPPPSVRRRCGGR